MAKPNHLQRAQPKETDKKNVDESTLAERWLKALKNNPLVAAVIVVGVCISGAMTFFNALPEQVQVALKGFLPLPSGEITASNGWVWAGYLDKGNVEVWATGPFVTIIKRSEAAERQYPIRIGDVITPAKDLPQVIIDYKTRKNDNVLVAPPKFRSVIQPESDYTGAKFKSGQRYIVADVSVAAFPGQDAVVWLRLINAD